MSRGERAAARAQAAVGTRFRPQGREAGVGLDCLGLVMVAHEIGADAVARDYRLRGDHAARLLQEGGRWFRRVPHKAARVGDVLLADTGRGQVHLLLLTAGGYIHADARRGRVVETPGAPEWPVRAVLRRRVRKQRN